MRISEIINIIKRNFLFGITVVLVLSIIMYIGYFIVYKKKIGGSKKINKKQLMVVVMFIGYISMVIGVTFLNRSSGIYRSVNLHFLSTYMEAWNSFNQRNWQFIILNILIFVPIGILLPLMNKRFNNMLCTLFVGLMITVTIECLQYLTGFGIFDLDDIFNNILGTAIGYSIKMSISEMLHKKKNNGLNIFMYLFPTVVTLVIFIGIFAYYNLREYGNLSFSYNYRVNMRNAEIFTDLELSSDKVKVPIYKAPTHNRETAKKFAIDFYENLNIKLDNFETIDYSDTSIYWIRGEPSYNIWVNYLDGSYRYSKFSYLDEEKAANVENDVLIKKLKQYGINVPASATLSSSGTGTYKWTVDMKRKDDSWVNGILLCTYYRDDEIKYISNNLVTYKKVKDIEIISEVEAYEKLKTGKFKLSNLSNNIKTIHITEVVLDYMLDSKGFLQPVYSFHTSLNDEETIIVIPVM
ncbi:VanZ family protein [Sedimentibacter hydroxybenzoicus]|nr:VanZ family protein [Sedimentibacter hydroxybenzoicus]